MKNGNSMQKAQNALLKNCQKDLLTMISGDKEVHDVLEFHSAWVPMPQKNEDYLKARNRLMGLLAGRKSTRNFLPAQGHEKIPKSSLDGARESIIQKNKELPKELVLKMRLQPGEQLCAVGLTKRLGGKKEEEIAKDKKIILEAFPSVVRVALDPWIRGVMKSDDEAKDLLITIKSICEKNDDIAQGAGRWQNGRSTLSRFSFRWPGPASFKDYKHDKSS